MADEDESMFSQGRSLRMSDLENTGTAERQAPALNPRRLEPITPQQLHSASRKRRKSKSTKPRSPPPVATVDASDDLLDESYMAQLRSRLDPTYHTSPTPSPPQTDISLSHEEDPLADQTTRDHVSSVAEEGRSVVSQETVDEGRGASEQRQRRRTRKKKTKTTDQDGEGAVVNTTRFTEAPDGEELATELTGLDEQVQEAAAEGIGRREQFRHELSCPRDPPFLVEEEDVREGPIGDHLTQLRLAHDQQPQQEETSTAVVYKQKLEDRQFVRLTHRRANQLSREASKERELANGYSQDISGPGFALACHKLIRSVSVGAHGLLAGVSLWDCVVTNVISRQEPGQVNLLQHYYPFPVALQSVYTLLVIIILVTLLDRFDISSTTKHCLQQCYQIPGEIALAASLLLVGCGFLTIVSANFLDEQIALFTTQPVIWSDIISNSTTTTPVTGITIGGTVYSVVSSESHRVTAWLVLKIIQALLFCSSWLLSLWAVNMDRMEDLLVQMTAPRNTVEESSIAP